MDIKIKKHNKLLKLILSALFLALAYVLPFLTGQIPEVGSMLCPMHLPVLLCGFICGPVWGVTVGAVAPLLRSMLTGGFPPMFPTAVCMAFELAAYGAVAGIMHKMLPKKKAFVYLSLLTAMAVGRLVWGAAMFVCLGINGTAFTFAAFLAGALTNAIPGIIIQIILIPILVIVLEDPKIIKFKK
jgi:LytS/YehU family sensor histidine kinase